MLRVVTMNVLQRKVCNMKTVIGALLLFVGFITMAGSAGDCDGKCMEYANTLGEMIIIALIGLTMTVIGGMILLNENSK